jgi:ATP-dependent 26S proteasome regulatory subunit
VWSPSATRAHATSPTSAAASNAAGPNTRTVVFAEHAEALLAAGRSLKRGPLLFGPPGIGKTSTVIYLVARMRGQTVILTTGRGMGMIQAVAQMARALAPAMVVRGDVDLIAQERGQPFQQTGPLLFELLNEMDGLSYDCDVIFVLTTNRPDILEPALAARPSRIDLAVEMPLPDATDAAASSNCTPVASNCTRSTWRH